jgi:hypothetical protein
MKRHVNLPRPTIAFILGTKHVKNFKIFTILTQDNGNGGAILEWNSMNVFVRLRQTQSAKISMDSDILPHVARIKVKNL